MKLDYKPLQHDLGEIGYIADDALAMALCLAIGLGRPLLLEGPAGVGKTEVGPALAKALKPTFPGLRAIVGQDRPFGRLGQR